MKRKKKITQEKNLNEYQKVMIGIERRETLIIAVINLVLKKEIFSTHRSSLRSIIPILLGCYREIVRKSCMQIKLIL